MPFSCITRIYLLLITIIQAETGGYPASEPLLIAARRIRNCFTARQRCPSWVMITSMDGARQNRYAAKLSGAIVKIRRAGVYG